jgi:Putative zinc-finger
MSMPEPGTPSSPPPTGPSEIECRQIAELLADYLDGTLPKRTVDLIDWHIDGCPPCVAFVNTYRGTIRATSTLRAVEVPAELKKRLLAVLRAQREGRSPSA